MASLDQLRRAVDRYQPLEAAYLAYPRDNELKKMWGRAADVLISAQLHFEASGLAKRTAEGALLTDLGDGRELLVWPFLRQGVSARHRLNARGWLARRGAGLKLSSLWDELVRALMTGTSVPNHFFGLLASRILIRDKREEVLCTDRGLDRFREMRLAAALYEKLEAAIASAPDDIDLKHRRHSAKSKIVSILIQQIDVQSPLASQRSDGSHGSDLGDGREVVVTVTLKSKVPKAERSRATGWLATRGKTHLDRLPDELWTAMIAGDPPIDLFQSMARVEIAIRHKT